MQMPSCECFSTRMSFCSPDVNRAKRLDEVAFVGRESMWGTAASGTCISSYSRSSSACMGTRSPPGRLIRRVPESLARLSAIGFDWNMASDGMAQRGEEPVVDGLTLSSFYREHSDINLPDHEPEHLAVTTPTTRCS